MVAYVDKWYSGWYAQWTTGAYVASEHCLAYLPYNWAADGTVEGCIYCHGRGQLVSNTGTGPGPDDPAATPGTFAIIDAIAKAGIPVLVADLGGATTWGITTVQTRIGQLKTYLQGTIGAKTGKIWLVGTSMGGLSALGYAGQNPTLVSAVVGIGPVSDLQDMVTNNRGGWAAEINAQYSGGYSDATYGLTNNPTKMALNGDYGTMPIKLYYGNTDTTVVPATVTTLASDVGASCTTVALSGGHAEATWALVPPADVVSFLKAHP